MSVTFSKACNFTKSNTTPWVFSRFLNCTNGTKLRKASHIIDLWLHESHKRVFLPTFFININKRASTIGFLPMRFHGPVIDI